MTQGDASLVVSTHREGSVPFRRNWAVDESRVEVPRDDRTSWQERMGLTVEEALQLRGLAGTDVLYGGGGDDVLDSIDLAVDRSSCGGGIDRVMADPIDVLASDCEAIQ